MGEILGMVIATAAGWTNAASIAISVVLAFVFGYLLTFQSLYRRNIPAQEAAKTTLATDTVSITSMEISDNLFIFLVPGALAAGLGDSVFWISLIASLAVAFVVTVPVNRFMLARGSMNHSHHH
jgi:hypothetical protein